MLEIHNSKISQNIWLLQKTNYCFYYVLILTLEFHEQIVKMNIMRADTFYLLRHIVRAKEKTFLLILSVTKFDNWPKKGKRMTHFYPYTYIYIYI